MCFYYRCNSSCSSISSTVKRRRRRRPIARRLVAPVALLSLHIYLCKVYFWMCVCLSLAPMNMFNVSIGLLADNRMCMQMIEYLRNVPLHALSCNANEQGYSHCSIIFSCGSYFSLSLLLYPTVVWYELSPNLNPNFFKLNMKMMNGMCGQSEHENESEREFRAKNSSMRKNNT